MQDQFISTLKTLNNMEFQLLLSSFLTFLVFVFVTSRIGKKFRAKDLVRNLPPGPKKLPFIGNLHQLSGGSLPHHRLADLAKEHGPLMHLKMGEVSAIVVSSPEAAKEVLHTQGTNFAGRPFSLSANIISYDSAGLAFSPYGDFWRQMRKICIVELLSAKRVQSFRPIREEEASSFVNAISSQAGSVLNLSEKISELTYKIVARAAFTRKFKGQEEFIHVLQEGGVVSAGFSFAELFPSIKLLHLISGTGPKMRKLHRKIDTVLENIVEEHRAIKKMAKDSQGEANAVQDFVDVLLDLQENEKLEFPLTTNNIKAIILDIFFAGSETSSTTVEWAMSELVRNPEILRKAQAEIRQVFDKKGKVDEEGLNELKYLKLVIKETLRLHPPGALSLPRENSEECQVFGFDIPAKTKVIVNIWAIGRDTNHWKEAERFWPERFSDSPVDYKGTHFELIPFGAGRRICPGISFATPNVELPLAALLFHFDWKVPDGVNQEDLDMTESFGLSVRRKNDLYLIPTPYHAPLPVG